MLDNTQGVAIALSAMATQRSEYERASTLPPLDPIPVLSRKASEPLQVDLELGGHSVIHLRLENPME